MAMFSNSEECSWLRSATARSAHGYVQQQRGVLMATFSCSEECSWLCSAAVRSAHGYVQQQRGVLMATFSNSEECSWLRSAAVRSAWMDGLFQQSPIMGRSSINHKDFQS